MQGIKNFNYQFIILTINLPKLIQKFSHPHWVHFKLFHTIYGFLKE